MFPKFNSFEINNNASNENIKKLGKCFKFDFEKGQHILIDGKFIECDFKENIQQFIQTVLRTKLNIFKVYTFEEEENFGLSIHNYIGEKISHKAYILSETKREITEQLLSHYFIKEVNSFNIDIKNSTLTISFNCYLKNNEILEIKEVIN